MIAVATEATLLGLLIHRRVWRKLPFLFVYCVWAILSDSSAYIMRLVFADGYGISFYLAETVVDFALQYCVLVELAWSVLRPVRTWLSPRALWVVAALFLAAGAALWPFAAISSLDVSNRTWKLMTQLQQTASMLRVLFFLLLALCSHFLSLGWRDRELQVATGFGFYSLVSLAVAALNTHQATASQFLHLYWVVAISFLCSLFYWIYCFAQKGAERHEFTPRMRSMLLSLAGAVHITGAAFADLASAGPRELDSR